MELFETFPVLGEKAWLEPTEGTPQNSVADDITKKVLGSGNHPGRAFREERGFPVWWWLQYLDQWSPLKPNMAVRCKKNSVWGEPFLDQSECGILGNLDTNEYPNIFESKNWHERISKYIRIKKFYTDECPNKYSSWKLYEYLNIFEYSSSFYTLTHWRTNVRIYSYKQTWYEWMSEYILKRKSDMNECMNIYSWPI